MLTDCYLPRLGGIEVQVHDLSQRLAQRGHEVEVFTITPGATGYGGTETIDGIPVHRYGLRLPRGLLVNPLAAPQMRRRLERFDAGHIHMGVVSPFATDAAVLVRRIGLPATMTWHCVLDRTEPLFGLVGHVRRWAQGGIAMNGVSEVAAAPLRRLTGCPVSVLPNGIDVDAWRVPGSMRPVRQTGPVRAVAAIRLERRKRPARLVELIARVRAAAPEADVRLEIFGEGSERRRVEQVIDDLGAAGWVTLAGRVPRDELRRKYAAADVYVSPAVLESFGIAALEARCAGLPVVGRIESGVGEFVSHGVNGLLAASDSELVDALRALVTDPELRQRMTEHNLRTRPEQSWSRVVEITESEYHRAGA